MDFITTGFSTMFDRKERITGLERWPVIGGLVKESLIDAMISDMAGLRYGYDCIKKAEIASTYAENLYGYKTMVKVGSLMVVSGDRKSKYGFYYQPPLEFHAWVAIECLGIIDIGLPGVIHVGLTTKDEYGYFLCGRKPSILAGVPPYWLEYDEQESYTPPEWREEHC